MQKATVTGSVGSAVLINKLVRTGKQRCRRPLSQSRGAKTVTAEFNHNLMEEMQNLDLSGDGLIIGDHERFQNKMIPMHDRVNSLGNDAGFVPLGGHELGAYGYISEGLPIYERDHSLSNMMTNRRVSHYTHPTTEMMSIYM
ncbi:hypothetical protein SO802_006695 [Lithocarpus litseifolius]|uniref:Uncharacterized protein n=1 Tax=Lithocarpus litseifolius TaxID=425828 RepID=A0AAW2DLM0_9ROSI